MTTTKTVTKIVLISIICAATMMSGCIEDDNLGVKTTPVTVSSQTPESVEIGTYYNPVSEDDAISSEDGFKMNIHSLLRGKDLDNAIMNANTFNSRPKEGYEYVLVFIWFENTGNDKFTLSGYDFKAFANDVECDNTFVVLPDKMEQTELQHIDVMPGGITHGTVVFEVPIDTQVIVCYDRMFSKSYYFDIGTKAHEYKK